MTLKFTHKGREMSADQFTEALARELLERGRQAAEAHLHGVVSSILDPETGKHPDVFVRRTGDATSLLTTRGSEALAQEINRRLGADVQFEEESSSEAKTAPIVYLAHASEDKANPARPLADRLTENGIQVWFDDWEIGSGDNLRQKMEEGLSQCTHFLALLSPISITKPWVKAEIDVGFVNLVGGQSRFIGLRAGVTVAQLSPFLRTLHCPEISLTDGSIKTLIADIYGISRRPKIGARPSYARAVPNQLGRWSTGAVAVAEYLVKHSKFGISHDPQAEQSTLADALGLPVEAVVLGVLDLREAGLIGVSESLSGPKWIWPEPALFVEFDQHFLGLKSKADALCIATWLLNEHPRGVSTEHLAEEFSDWNQRRINSALNFLNEAKVVLSSSSIGTCWASYAIHPTDRTLRFTRENS
jgi:hypothetical protein